MDRLLLLGIGLLVVCTMLWSPVRCYKDPIHFPAVPKGVDYKTSLDKEEGALMKGWYSAVKVFINTVQPNTPPVESVYKYVTGKKEFKMMESLKEILDIEKGFFACLIFGLLFTIVMPIVGLFFCLCRICGNCGGKMVQAQKDNLKCRRRTYLLILFLTFAIMTIAAINMFTCNEKITQTIPKSHKIIIDNLDDSQAFVNNTYTQLNFLVQDVYDVVEKSIFHDFDMINETLGVPVRDSIRSKLHTDLIFDQLHSFASDSNSIVKKIFDLLDKASDINTEVDTDLVAKLKKIDELKNKFTTDICKNVAGVPEVKKVCNTLTSLKLEDAAKFTDQYNYIKKKVDMVSAEMKGKKLEKYVELAEGEFDLIPDHVKQNTKSIRKDVKKIMGDIKTKIRKSSQWTNLKDITTQVEDSMDDAKKTVDDIVGGIEKYKKYVWWAGLTICLVMSACLAFMILGMCCGVLGTKADALPTQRSFVSNMGGVSLMSSVGFMFIFSSILMILTMVAFLIGAHGEAFICNIMYNKIEMFDEIKDLVTEDMTNKPYIKDLKISEVLKSCKENKPAYVALQLQNQFNISSIKNLIDEKSIEDQIDSIQVNLKDVDVIPANFKSSLDQYAKGVSINFDDVTKVLETNLLKIDVNDYVTKLKNAISNLPNDPAINAAKKEIKPYIEELEDFANHVLSNAENLRKELLTFIKDQKPKLENFHVDLTNVTSRILELSVRLDNSTFVMSIIKPPLMDFRNLILSKVNQYIDHLDIQATQKVAKCEPLWNVFDSVRFVVCHLTLDPFNGFWFALGWCLAFFIPAIIFSIKLARHFRKMKYTQFEGQLSMDEGEEQVSRRDTSWMYSKGSRKDETDHPHKHWVNEMQPIHAYDNGAYRQNR